MKKFMFLVPALFIGCSERIQSAGGISMATVDSLQVDRNGHTTEQANIIAKIKADGDPDKLWYIYVISPYSGKVIFRSIAKGKITSSGKRLTPKQIAGVGSNMYPMAFPLGLTTAYTNELPSEDGAFGDSSEYIYWKDEKGRSRRHFITGGQIIHVSDQNMSNKELVPE